MEKRITTPERLNFSELSLIINWNLRNTLKTYAKKPHLKLYVLCRIQKFLTVEKARIFANAFINSQFNYAPVIWMLASKTAINKILKIHYRTLPVVYSEYHKSYEELLQINKDISIHQKHLRILALKVHKSIMQFNPEFMWHLCGIIQTSFLINWEREVGS